MPRPRAGERGALRGLIRLLWQQALWAIPFALFFGLLNDRGGGLRTYLFSLRLSLVFSYAIGLGLWAVEYFVLPRLRASATPLTPLRIGLAFAAGCFLAAYAAAVVIHFSIFPGFLGSTRRMLVFGTFTLLFFTLFSGINFAIAYYRESMDRARMLETMRAELAEAELRALRAQIHPHFLFNTLNSIAALIRSDPLAAEETTTRLADIFRYALHASERPHTRFGEELAFLRDYLEIEHTRFGDRLRVEERIEPGLESVAVPSLLLQPLVENAVRHGIGGRERGGTVVLEARRDGDTLRVAIADDGPGFDPDARPSGSGFGLHSVRERLRVAGAPHALSLSSAPGRGTRVEVTLPLVPSAPSAPAGASLPPCPGERR